VPPRAPQRIAAALSTLFADDAMRARLGAAGRRRARRYGWPRIARETYAVLDALSAAPARNRRDVTEVRA
jgi:glycosyltransferase involved in cell wall biosynthesis